MDTSGYINAILLHPMERVDGHKVLDVLFDFYAGQRLIDDEVLFEEYKNIYEQLNHKSIKEITEIELPLHSLVEQYEKRGFKEGLKVGLYLSNELIT